ncbi:hypothetical protein A3K93_09985 [Acinetobacter sp. NCu2D-2]|uniref:hypothetical protein n=1 Tax=Acinetobacter sp. NCu2D-2 TaxID=1608473 RepID=UPI0007CDF40D|nr:hypothetical protein [Acinetobacter sp. NCu2D-2]ANF82486.1 hypothetical protein A3K93_09985 [Acinetobacter sp. NCu2D-2]
MSATALFDLRRENLSKLIDHWIASKRFETGKAMCEYFEIEPTYIAQLLNTKKQIGEKAARELEQKLALKKGSLDQKDLDVSEGQTVTVACYGMKTIESELFQLQRKAFDLGSISILNLNNTHYLIEMSSTIYQPIIPAASLVICEQAAELKDQDRSCVYLSNGYQLFLTFMHQDDKYVAFQSLDGKRKIQLNQDDIKKIDRIVAIVSP